MTSLPKIFRADYSRVRSDVVRQRYGLSLTLDELHLSNIELLS